jgi:hypothetical protein
MQVRDQSLAPVYQSVKDLSGRLHDALERGIGRIHFKRALVKLPGAMDIAADKVPIRDAEMGARDLFLADKLITARQLSVAELDRADLSQCSAEVALAEQILDL